MDPDPGEADLSRDWSNQDHSGGGGVTANPFHFLVSAHDDDDDDDDVDEDDEDGDEGEG